MATKYSKELISELLSKANSGEYTVKQLAGKYNMHVSYVYDILRGKKWKSINREKYVNIEGLFRRTDIVDYKTCKEIRERWKTVKNKTHLAQEFNITWPTVHRILKYQNNPHDLPKNEAFYVI